MRITNKVMVESLNRNLQRSMQRLDRYFEQLSTGRKFSRPSQDPVGAFFSMRTRSSLETNDQFLRNVNNGLDWLEMTENSMQSLGEVLHRTRELMVYGANRIHDESSLNTIAEEIDQIKESLMEISQARIGDRYIFSGQETLLAPFQKADGTTIKELEILNDRDHGLERLKARDLRHGQYEIYTQEYTGAHQESTIELTQETKAALLGEGDVSVDLDNEYNVSLALQVKDVQRDTIITDAEGDAALKAAALGEDITLILEEGAAEEVSVEDTGGGSYTVRVTYEEGATAAHIHDLITQDSGDVPEARELITLDLIDGEAEAQEFNNLLSEQEVDLTLTAHIYDREGNYIEHAEQEFFGVNMAREELDITLQDGEGNPLTDIVLEQDRDWTIEGIQEGDGAVYALTPELEEDVSYHIMRSDFAGENGASWFFQEETFNDSKTTLNLFTIETDPESDNYRKLYDGTIDATFTSFADGEGEPVATFTMGEGAVYQGDEADILVRLAPGVEITVNLNGREVFSDIFDLLTDFARNLREADGDAISGPRMQEMDEIMGEFIAQRAMVGSRMRRLDLSKTRLSNMEVELTRTLEEVEHVDIARVISQLKMEESVYRAALASGARVVQPTLLDFLR